MGYCAFVFALFLLLAVPDIVECLHYVLQKYTFRLESVYTSDSCIYQVPSIGIMSHVVRMQWVSKYISVFLFILELLDTD